MATRNLVIWAHSECRSNAALYSEVKRLAEARGFRVTMCLWDEMPMDESRKSHGLEWIKVGDNLKKGREILAAYGGKDATHVFCVYQNSSVWRRLIVEAKKSGAGVIVSAEAPCPMCVGLRAWLKRLYYHWVLPWKVRCVVKAADLFLNASGMNGVDELIRLGWAMEKIVPFGYASDVVEAVAQRCSGRMEGSLHVLHTGKETAYRDVGTLKRAVDALRGNGVTVDLACTGGKVSEDELAKLYAWADVFVACGLCEPWGMRVNDAIHAGLPIVISSGMGSKWLVERFGCGAVFRKGSAKELADILERIAKDSDYRKRLISGAAAAHEAWTPEARAKVWLNEVLSA